MANSKKKYTDKKKNIVAYLFAKAISKRKKECGGIASYIKKFIEHYINIAYRQGVLH